MRVAVVGSRNLSVNNLGEYLPENVTEIISGGAMGVDTSAREYAKANNIPFTEILPDYKRYGGKVAPIKRNDLIIDAADIVLVFWDGKSRGTKYVINRCENLDKEVRIFKVKEPN